jgi:hypothetical protein
MRERFFRFPGWSVLALGIGALVLAPSVSNAQQIGGTVSDSTGGVLPGVTVEARSPDIIEAVRTGITDGNGQYMIVALEPGTYEITYTLPGFGTFIRDEIMLQTGFTANIDVELSVGDIQETVTVSGASPVVDIQRVEQQAVMDRQIIDSIPTGKSISTYGLLIPGMSGAQAYGTALQQDAGGLSVQTMQRLMIHGGSEDDQMVNINGMDVAQGHTQGGDLGYFPAENYEEMAFSYAGNSAEVESGGVSVDMIPKEGGNTFSGGVFSTFSFPGLLADNLSQAQRDRGLLSTTALKKNWTITPTVGGPIVQDKLWFFLTHTSRRADMTAPGLFYSKDPGAFVYEPDLSRPGIDEAIAREQSFNITWQASSQDKIKLYWTNSSTDRPHYLQGRALGSLFVVPEASVNNVVRTNAYQMSWTRPQTNRLLFEAGVSHMPMQYDLGHALDADLSAPGVFEVSPLKVSRNSSSWLSGTDGYFSPKTTNFYRGSMSFVTGTHNLKIGTQFNQQQTMTTGESEFWTRLWTIRGNPFRATFYTGLGQRDDSSSLGLYVQEQWTLDRLTINAGVRYDRITSGYPDMDRPVNQWAPIPFAIPALGVSTWQDLQPRIGLAYDLRGDGRTALKFSASRYGSREATDWSQNVNPAGTNRTMNRTWLDGRVCLDPSVCIAGDGKVQGDPTNPAPNGELISPNTNLAFGLPKITTFHDPDWAFGWGKREANWEFSGSMQHELMSGMSLDVAYFRRVWINRSIVDNRAIGSEDFALTTLNVPTDSRLPNSGGTLTYYDLLPTSIRVPDSLTVGSEMFGGESEIYNGIDVTLDARIDDVLLQGGLSTGRVGFDYCNVQAQLPEAVRPTWGGASISGADTTPLEVCSRTQAWLTQVKLLGSYTFPYGIQIAATLQNQPGPEIAALYTFTDTPSVLYPGGTTLNMLTPGTMYGERFSQLDLRFTKLLDLGQGTRLRAMFDMFNVANANAVMAEQQSFGPSWRDPVVIMPGRLMKFALQLDF